MIFFQFLSLLFPDTHTSLALLLYRESRTNHLDGLATLARFFILWSMYVASTYLAVQQYGELKKRPSDEIPGFHIVSLGVIVPRTTG